MFLTMNCCWCTNLRPLFFLGSSHFPLRARGGCIQSGRQGQFRAVGAENSRQAGKKGLSGLPGSLADPGITRGEESFDGYFTGNSW